MDYNLEGIIKRKGVDGMKFRLAIIKTKRNLPGDTNIIDDAINNGPNVGLKILNKNSDALLWDIMSK